MILPVAAWQRRTESPTAQRDMQYQTWIQLKKGPSVKSRLNVTSSLSDVQTQPSDKGQKTQVPINLSIHRISKQFVWGIGQF